MCQETEKIKEMTKQMLVESRKFRTIEMQNCSWLSANYFQGCIDALTDVLVAIEQAKAETKRLNGGQEVE